MPDAFFLLINVKLRIHCFRLTFGQVIHIIRQKLTQEDIDFLLGSDDGKVLKDDESNMFGTKIQYYEAKPSWPDTEKLHDMSTRNKNEHLENFTMAIVNNTPSIRKTEV